MTNDIDPERLERYRELAEQEYIGEVDETMRPYLEAGVENEDSPVWYYFSSNGMFRAPHRKNPEEMDIACLGVPLDIGTPNQRTGSRQGPRALRKWSLNHGPANGETGVNPFEVSRVADYGDVAFTRDAYTLESCLEQLENLYSRFHEAGVIPLSIGGEHTITYPILKALATDEPLGLVHLDAHPDTRTGSYQGTEVTDANLFTQATVDGLIDPQRTIQIGVRGRVLATNQFSHETGMTTVPATEFQERGAAEVAELAREVVGDGPCYLTVDTDVFDPSAMPGTTLPEPFGLTGREVRDLLRGLRGLDFLGADLVELNPMYDQTGQSGCLAAGVAFEEMCLLAEARLERTEEVRRTQWE
jgi:agmatinase